MNECKTCKHMNIDAGAHPCVECIAWEDNEQYLWEENPAITELRTENKALREAATALIHEIELHYRTNGMAWTEIGPAIANLNKIIKENKQ